MTNLKQFRNEIIIYAAAVAILAEVVSLFIIGINAWFSLGLAVGTAVTIVGFVLLVRTGEQLLLLNVKAPIICGYIFRIVLYAVAFFLCIRINLFCGAGCGIGFITIHIAIMVLYGIVYTFIKKKKNPLNDWIIPKKWNDLSIYDEEDDWDLSRKKNSSGEAEAEPEK